jgi:hypothetical protein
MIIKARALICRAAVAVGAVAAAVAGLGIGIAHAQPGNVYSHHHQAALMRPQPSDPSGGPSCTICW